MAFRKIELTNATHDLYTLLAKNDKFKYITTSQRLIFNSLSLFYIFYLIVFFFIITFQTLMHKETKKFLRGLFLLLFPTNDICCN